jgi:hypothetical protein
MKFTRVSTLGLALIGLGLLIILSYAIWAKSIRTIVLDVPVPMRADTLSQNFSVDYDAIYTMRVRFDRGIPADFARCVLGAQKSQLGPDLDCKTIAPALKFSWALSRDGKNGGTGSSEDAGSSSMTEDSLDVSIVSFPARKKHQYTASFKFDEDARVLKISPPRIQIELDVFNREDFIWAGAAFDSIGLLLCMIGGITFLLPILRNKFKQPK